MEVTFAPELQAQLNELASQSGKSTDQLVHDAVAGYVGELAELRCTLERRDGEIKSRWVLPIDGEEGFRRLRETSIKRQQNV